MADSQRTTTVVVHADPTRPPAKWQGERASQKTSDELEDEPAVGPWVSRPLYGDGREAFFPIAPYDAVYEIEINGTFTYSGGSSYPPKADALSHVSVGSGRHDWLRINGLTLDYWLAYQDAEMLQADYESHVYRFHIQDDPGKQVKLALQVPAPWVNGYMPRDSSLTAEVRAVAAASVILPGPRARVKAKEATEAARHSVEVISPVPVKPAETDDAYRERWCRNIDRSNDDMRAVLAKIADGRQKLMDDLAALNLDPNGDIYLQYKAEIENWTANQLVLFSGRKGTDHGSATLIG